MCEKKIFENSLKIMELFLEFCYLISDKNGIEFKEEAKNEKI